LAQLFEKQLQVWLQLCLPPYLRPQLSTAHRIVSYRIVPT